jgi:lipopolysaccharide transport system ATP-binding protein
VSEIAIRMDGISKRYRLGQRQPYRALRDVITEALATPFRQRLAMRGESMRRAGGRDGYVWALRDLSLEIRCGEVLGIVGRNGAGKSTLLKIVSRITEPTTGSMDIYGRVGSLLEVGTGFHPELTGRENTFLNGAILGMKRAEIQRKFDDIVAFAEVATFIDTPVKRYSTGMRMRLAFAVAAHLDPEILIVDEVLAVGDLAFQNKCLGKMDDAARQGRTVLFVSHNLDAIQRLCSHCVLLENGRLVAYDSSSRIVKQYLSSTSHRADAGAWIDLSGAERTGSGEVRFTALRHTSDDGAVGFHPYTGGPVEFALSIEADDARTISSLAVVVSSQSGTRLVNADTILINQRFALRPGNNTVTLRIHALHLNPGIYRVGLWIADPISAHKRNIGYDFIDSACEIEVLRPPGWALTLPPNACVACDFELIERVCASRVLEK